MNFGQALELLKSGKNVTRKDWNDEGTFLQYAPETTTHIGETIPHIAITIQDSKVPWSSSQTDILAEDWLVVE